MGTRCRPVDLSRALLDPASVFESPDELLRLGSIVLSRHAGTGGSAAGILKAAGSSDTSVTRSLAEVQSASSPTSMMPSRTRTGKVRAPS